MTHATTGIRWGAGRFFSPPTVEPIPYRRGKLCYSKPKDCQSQPEPAIAGSLWMVCWLRHDV